MAINYEQVGWDTSKYVNPTNMNKMDNGIKAACDKADAHDQQIETINSNLTESKIMSESKYQYKGLTTEFRCLNGLKMCCIDGTTTESIPPWTHIAYSSGFEPTNTMFVKTDSKYDCQFNFQPNTIVQTSDKEIPSDTYIHLSLLYF